jgi:hypothetical protein
MHDDFIGDLRVLSPDLLNLDGLILSCDSKSP